MEVYLRDDFKTTLKSVSSKTWEGCNIGVQKSKNQCRGNLGLSLETPQDEEIIIKTILNSNTMK